MTREIYRMLRGKDGPKGFGQPLSYPGVGIV